MDASKIFYLRVNAVAQHFKIHYIIRWTGGNLFLRDVVFTSMLLYMNRLDFAKGEIDLEPFCALILNTWCLVSCVERYKA